MQTQRFSLLCAAIWLAVSSAQATTVFRCQSSDGHLTYTLNGCPSTSEQHTQHAFNPTPGSDQATPMAAPEKRHKPSTTESSPVVVGKQQDGCGNQLNRSARRTAIIRQEVRSGMSRNDIESALGKPDKITSNNGTTRYTYEDRKGNRRQVNFDENGCVKSKR